MTYLLEYQGIAFVALVFLVLVGFLIAMRNMPWPDRANFASTVSGIIVALAFVLAGFEYLLHYQGDRDRKRQAVLEIQRVSIGSERLDRAYSGLFDHDPEEVLRQDDKSFDEKIATLAGLFWGVGGCARAKQCDEEVTRAIFCFDFLTYKHAYLETHKGKLWQDFNDPSLDVFKTCPARHRFDSMAPPSK